MGFAQARLRPVATSRSLRHFVAPGSPAWQMLNGRRVSYRDCVLGQFTVTETFFFVCETILKF